MKKKRLIKAAFVDSLPVLSGYIVLGIGFGLLLRTKGFGVGWALFMSVFIFAGSMQYVAIDLMSGGASLLATALTTLMVNIRHLFYGLSMLDQYRGSGAKKPYLIFALTDETYSIACHNPYTDPQERHTYCLFLSLFDQCYWVTGSVLGSLLGTVLPFSTEGIDFSLTALFVTVFVDQWLTTKHHFAAMTGVICTLFCLVLFGTDVFLIPSMMLITVVLTLGKPFAKEKNDA